PTAARISRTARAMRSWSMPAAGARREAGCESAEGLMGCSTTGGCSCRLEREGVGSRFRDGKPDHCRIAADPVRREIDSRPLDVATPWIVAPQRGAVNENALNARMRKAGPRVTRAVRLNDSYSPLARG